MLPHPPPCVYPVDIQGENNFDSGWEWGYWLNSVGNARAVWNPYIMAQTQRQAFTMLLNSFFGVFGDAAAPMAELVADITEAQLDLLVYGNTTGAGVPGGRGDSAVVKRNGMAYLVGWDTWSELAFGGTQPSRVAPESISNSSGMTTFFVAVVERAKRVRGCSLGWKDTLGKVGIVYVSGYARK